MASWEKVDVTGLEFLRERNVDALLEKFLASSREITAADAGLLYLVEEEPRGGRHLVFKLNQCDSLSLPFRQFTLPIDTRTISGYVAATGETLNIEDAYQIPNLPLRFNRDFDQKFGYRTKSMLAIPMKNREGDVIGVLQLINAKRHREAKLTSPEAAADEVVPFPQPDQEQVSSLASHAAVALETSLVYGDVERLFDGFVKSLLTLIESRDPTTFGHSERVAKLTLGLAEAVDRCDSGPYKDIHFTREDLREIRYASLLHDIGTICIREDVLVKAKKLYPSQLERVKNRFLSIHKTIELESLRKKLDYVVRNGNQSFQEFFASIDGDQLRQFQTLEEFLNAIVQANEPTVLPEKTSAKLAEIADWTLQEPSGLRDRLLTTDEQRLLSIPIGCLDERERLEIESHVIYSYRFLSQIPWPKDLKNIPLIVRAHHEKLDGSGYPYHMKSGEIPLQSKMLAIADTYDSLTARDRPYRRALPAERAREIIGEEASSNHLDPALVQLFVGAKVYEITGRD